jgi:hypothetical protein
MVEVVEDRARLVLEYIAMLQRQGYRPAVAEVDAYAARPHRKDPTRQSIAASIGTMMEAALSGPIVESGETYLDYMKRLRWVKVSQGTVALTPLALAMLRDLNSPKVDPEAQSYVEVTVDPSDKMSFARLLNQFNNLGPGLLVDPYLRLEQFLEVADATPVTRVLTSSRAFGTDPQRRLYQRALSAADGKIQVRHIDKLHDRHYIPETGNIWMLGVSLNGVAKNISVLTQLGHESSNVLRDAYEGYWRDSLVLEPTGAHGAATSENAADGGAGTE